MYYKKIWKCDIKWLNYVYINSKYSYYINTPDYSKINNVTVNKINFWNENNGTINVNDNKNLIWKTVKIIVWIKNIYNENDINYCEKEIIIKNKPITNYCKSN